MTELNFYLLCIMIAAPQGALGSATRSHSGAPISRVDQDEISISLPPDSEFVEKRVKSSDFIRNRDKYWVVLTDTHEECLSEANSNGAHAFKIGMKGCHFYTFKAPLCNRWEGDEFFYIRKDMLSDGSPSDNATFDVGLYQRYVPDDVLRYYRIESPTIVEFGNLPKTSDSTIEMKYFLILPGDEKKYQYSDSLILADPSCYTTSTCSEIFVTIAPEIPASDLFILYDICGQSVQVDSGRSIYVLSHEGIGCKNFPNNYPVADCWAEFTGAGKITINVTFINFRESDHCDGFTMKAVTNRVNGCATRISTDLCDETAPTELTSAGGKVRFEFGGSASTTREKYGFHFQITAA